jgi:hypothetical protein
MGIMNHTIPGMYRRLVSTMALAVIDFALARLCCIHTTLAKAKNRQLYMIAVDP